MIFLLQDEIYIDACLCRQQSEIIRLKKAFSNILTEIILMISNSFSWFYRLWIQPSASRPMWCSIESYQCNPILCSFRKQSSLSALVQELDKIYIQLQSFVKSTLSKGGAVTVEITHCGINLSSKVGAKLKCCR